MTAFPQPKSAVTASAAVDPGRIAFDIDGVIADTMHLFLDIARDEFQVHGIRYEDITCYNLADCIDMDREMIDRIIGRILEGGYAAQLNAIPGAPEVLVRLSRRSRPVLCVTARPHIGPVGDFVHRIMGGSGDAVDIVATGSFEAKSEVLRQRGITHFVEDRLETCFVLSAAGITPILFAQPWNRSPHPFIEVSRWCEIDELIRW